jgi:hypothetical protein
MNARFFADGLDNKAENRITEELNRQAQLMILGGSLPQELYYKILPLEKRLGIMAAMICDP